MFCDSQPGPMSTSRRLPMPSSSRTARHFFPLASLVKVTPETLLPLLLPLSPTPTWSPSSPVTRREEEEEPIVLPLRTRSADDSEPPVAGPAGVPGPAVVVEAGPAVVPVGCGAVAVCGAGVVVSVTLAVCDTGVVPAVGEVVLVVSDFTTAGATVVGGVVVTDWRTASDGFEPPPPLTGTVVVGAGWAAVVAAGAAVVGGVVVATGTLLAVVPCVAVPWDWVPAAAGAGTVCAEAGRAFSTRKSPARSAKAATHLRGRTSSILGLLLIGLNRPPG